MITNGSASMKRGKSEDEYNCQGKAAFPTKLFSILWMTYACGGLTNLGGTRGDHRENLKPRGNHNVRPMCKNWGIHNKCIKPLERA